MASFFVSKSYYSHLSRSKLYKPNAYHPAVQQNLHRITYTHTHARSAHPRHVLLFLPLSLALRAHPAGVVARGVHHVVVADETPRPAAAARAARGRRHGLGHQLRRLGA